MQGSDKRGNRINRLNTYRRSHLIGFDNMKKIKIPWKLKAWIRKYRVRAIGRFIIEWTYWMHEQRGFCIKLGIEYKTQKWEIDHIGRITYYKSNERELSIHLIKFKIDFFWAGRI